MAVKHCRTVLWALGLCCIGSARADEVDDAIALLRSGKADAAYQSLLPLAQKQRGNARLDVVLGITALDSGHNDAAIAAFEKVLERSPRLTAVRADLARAYLAVGRYADARRELKQVLSENPPDQAKPFLERLLAAAESGEHAEKYGVLTGFVETGRGTNSNITAVTSSFTSGVQGAYGLPGFQPTGNSILRSASFTKAAAGLDYIKPLNPNWAFTSDFSGEWRGYDNDSAYNQTTGDLRLGTLYVKERHLLRLNADFSRYNQQTTAPGNPAPTANRNTTGLSADWRYDIDPLYSVGAFLADNRMRYPDNRVLDADETQWSLSLTRRFLSLSNASVTISPSWTDDRAKNIIPGSATGSNYSKTALGARLSGQFDPRASVTAYLSFGYFERKDGSSFARSTLIANGVDRQRDYAAGGVWRFAPNWSIRAEVSVTANRSNIALYSYDSTETFVGVRRDFR